MEQSVEQRLVESSGERLVLEHCPEVAGHSSSEEAPLPPDQALLEQSGAGQGVEYQLVGE